MKKYLAFLLCIINLFSFALTAYCLADEPNLNKSNSKPAFTSQEDLKKIDEETKNCINVHYETDYTMMMCVIEGTKKYTAEIEKMKKAAQSILSKPRYEGFLKAQYKWEKSLSKFNYISNMEYLPFQPRLLAENDRYHYIKSRAEYLSKFMDNFSK